MARSDALRLFFLRFTMPICLIPAIVLGWVDYIMAPSDIYSLIIMVLSTFLGLRICYFTINSIDSAFVGEDGISIDGELIAWKDISKIRVSWFSAYRVSTNESRFYFAPSGSLVGFNSFVLWGDDMYSIFAKRGFMQRSAFNY